MSSRSPRPPKPSTPSAPPSRERVPAAPPPRARVSAAPPPRTRAAAAPTARRQATRAQSRRPAPASNDRLPLLIGGGVLLLLVVLIVVFALTNNPTPTAGTTTGGTTPLATMAANNASTPVPAVAKITGEIAKTFTNRGHSTDPLTYQEVPPMGGPHWGDWMNCGIYDKPLQNEQGVHSLEHGAVWITYQPDLATASVETLRNIIRQSDYRLLSPYPNLPQPVVVSAWGYQLALGSPDDPRLMQFINLHQQDPAGPEPGASCRGSVGTPLP